MVTDDFKIVELSNGRFILKRKYLIRDMGFLNWFRKLPKLNEEWLPIENRNVQLIPPIGRFPIKEFKSKIDAESYATQLINKKYPIETLYP